MHLIYDTKLFHQIGEAAGVRQDRRSSMSISISAMNSSASLRTSSNSWSIITSYMIYALDHAFSQLFGIVFLELADKIQNTYEVRLGATHKSSRIGQDESERIAQLQNEYDHLHQQHILH